MRASGLTPAATPEFPAWPPAGMWAHTANPVFQRRPSAAADTNVGPPCAGAPQLTSRAATDFAFGLSLCGLRFLPIHRAAVAPDRASLQDLEGSWPCSSKAGQVLTQNGTLVSSQGELASHRFLGLLRVALKRFSK